MTPQLHRAVVALNSRGAEASGSQFKQRDKNSDGKLGKDELPGALFDRLDVNKDGFVTEEEAKALSKPQP